MEIGILADPLLRGLPHRESPAFHGNQLEALGTDRDGIGTVVVGIRGKVADRAGDCRFNFAGKQKGSRQQDGQKGC